jgi:glycosyltransferase involved in cell wall biosynthesis
MGITAVIITKDEEKNISRCLASLAGVVDEIIIADGSSKDKTVEIATAAGAKCVQMEWLGYSETKNKANALAAHDYILSMDADEALSDELRTSILSVKNKLSGAYLFNRRNHYCGKWIRHCGWYPDRKVRLFPKEGTKWQGEYVHETLALPAGTSETFLSGDLMHYSYDSIDAHVGRANRYSSLAADEILAKNKKALLLRCLFAPQWKFFKMFFLQLGFLDRFYGFTVCMIGSYEVFLKYAKAIQRRCECEK